MTTELMTHEGQAVFIPPQPAEHLPATINVVDVMVSALDKICQSDTKDLTNLHSFLDAIDRQHAKQAEQAFNKALAAVQRRAPRIPKNGVIKTNTGAKVPYSTSGDIDDAMRPLLAEYGLSLTSEAHFMGDNIIKVITFLRHDDGHKEQTEVPLPIEKTNNLKDETKAFVSTYSYGRRVNTIALLNLVADDNMYENGVSASGPSDKDISDLKAIIEKGGYQDVVQTLLTSLKSESIDALTPQNFAYIKHTITTKAKNEGKL